MMDKRNQSCPCGSGKRYKKCCGSVGGSAAVSKTGLMHENMTGTLSAAESFRLGEAAVVQRRLEEAAGYFRQALKLQPDHAEALNRLGVICLTQGKLDEAVASFQHLLTLKPDNVEAYFNLGVTFYDQGKLDDAIGSFRQLLELKPDHVEAHFNLGNFLMAQGKLDEAIASFRQALLLKPDYAEARCNMGLIFKELGKKDDAVACFRQALSLKPDYARAYKGLSLSVKYTEADDVIETMENLYNKKEISEADRKDLGFALGKAFEDLENYDKSFNFTLAANRLKRNSYQYSIQNEHNFFARIRKTFSSDFFAAHDGSGYHDRTPIFIIGMPRSGTTLVEQILASHPLVFGAGELALLVNLTNSVCTGRETARYPECISGLSHEALERMGAEYMGKIREYSNDAKYITDKMPNNFLRVGLIRTILPAAKVIHCVRNPMDTCFSIFKMDFTSPHGFAYDMEELGQYYKLYRDLMAHWEKVLPGFMYTIRYEELVAEQQKQTEGLLQFCDLPWDEACLEFYRTKRRVSTASLVQVRQPIYKDSVELWKRYEKQLEPLRKTIYGQ